MSVGLINTVLSGNSGSTRGTTGVIADDLDGPLVSLGHNLIGKPDGLTNLLSSDLVGVNPRLGPLRDNGGPTLSHALLANSPALDAGTSGNIVFDQRGQPRTIDNPTIPNASGSDGTDIGATEVDPVLRITRVSRTGDDTTLRFTTVSDGSYRVQYRSDLIEEPWITLPFSIAGSGGIVAVTNAVTGSTQRRFYRAVRQ